MTYSILLLMGASLIIAYYHPDRKTKYWMIVMLLSGAFCLFHVLLLSDAFNYLDQLPDQWYTFLVLLIGLISISTMPYVSLILVFVHTVPSERGNRFVGMTIATILITTSLTPIPSEKSKIIVLFLLAGGLVLFIVYMHIKAIKLERRRVIRKYQIHFFAFTVPVVITFLVVNNLLVTTSVYLVFFIPVIPIFLTCLLLYALWTGLLGVKLRFDKQQAVGTRRSMTTGTSLITHTIKNEMAKVQFMLNQMEEAIDQENHATLKNMTESIRSSSEHLIRLNKRIKEATSDSRLEREPFAISTLLKEIYDQYELMSLHDNRYRISFYASHDFILNLDVVHMKEVLINLINNAMESSSDPAQQINIELNLKEENNRAVLSISDTGNGIPKAIQSRIQEPFYTTKNGGKNYGLGLSYCRGVIEMHGAKMKIVSQEGQGTLVALTFPSRVILARAQLTP